MTDLIDTTEMYLRTILELEEEGIVPMRARIAERLEHSGPTVSQTVARMEKHGLLTGVAMLVMKWVGVAPPALMSQIPLVLLPVAFIALMAALILSVMRRNKA